MKKISTIILLITSIFTFSQEKAKKLKIIYLNKDVTTHFVSTQKIDYTDISTKNVVGDMPVDNILRLKPIKNLNDALGVVTIVGEGFFVQYKLEYIRNSLMAHKKVLIDVDDINEFNNPNFSMTSTEIKNIAVKIRMEKPKINTVISKKYKLTIVLNNIYSLGDYFFVDYSILNKTNIKYDIDQIRYKIVDKKVSKEENNQDIEIEKVFELEIKKSFKKKYRNIVVFKKFTFPDNKIFTIEVAETQISGRTIILNISYSDILNADTF